MRATSLLNMSTPTPDFEKKFVAAIRKNLRDVVTELENGDKNLKKKIKTFSSRFAFVESQVKAKIRDDEMFRAFFAKDPGKQKIHENIAAAFIANIPTVSNFKQLAHDDTQLLGGAVISRKDARKGGGTSRAKSLDFYWETCGIKVYASHKYTKSSGGAQDNQYRDLQEFIREANQSNLRGAIFLAIADGKYYLTNDAETDTTKLARLKRLTNRENVFALSIAEIEAFLDELCMKSQK